MSNFQQENHLPTLCRGTSFFRQPIGKEASPRYNKKMTLNASKDCAGQPTIAALRTDRVIECRAAVAKIYST